MVLFAIPYGRTVATHGPLAHASKGGPAMRKAAGVALIFLGVTGLAICGIVLFHLQLPALAWLLRHRQTVAILMDPIEGPLSSIGSVTVGVLLLRANKLTSV